MKSKQCSADKHHYDECVERVTKAQESDEPSKENCVEECRSSPIRTAINMAMIADPMDLQFSTSLIAQAHALLRSSLSSLNDPPIFTFDPTQAHTEKETRAKSNQAYLYNFFTIIQAFPCAAKLFSFWHLARAEILKCRVGKAYRTGTTY